MPEETSNTASSSVVGFESSPVFASNIERIVPAALSDSRVPKTGGK
jgi:hypothetical protein